MATYIQGVTDYIPQIQQFRPDFNFYNKALQMKQGKYDAAHKQLSNLYGSLLNAPMLRDKNVEERDQFFKTIDQDIQRMSGMDLSLEQNVDAAAGVFNQLLDNDNIVKDMVWTKSWQNEHKKADGFKRCVDPEKCGGAWWEGGVKALDYKAQEFKAASDDDAMRFSNASFTAYQDVTAKAIKLAKDAGLSISIDQLQGGYITTTKNGPMLVGPLQQLFMGSLGKDPKVMEYYKTKAYVDRKDWIQGNIGTYGSEDGAKAAYYNNVSEAMSRALGLEADNIEYRNTSTDTQKKALEEKIKTQGTTQDSSLANQYREMNNVSGNYAQSKEVINEGNDNAKIAGSQGYSDAMLAHIDNAVAAYSLGTDIGNAAETLAYKDYEFKMKADPYSLESFKQKNRVALEDRRAYNDMLVKKYEYDLEQVALDEAARGDITDNMPIYKKLIEGGVNAADRDGDGIVTSEEAATALQEVRGEVESNISQPEQDIMSRVFDLTKMQSQQEGPDGGAASDDLIKFFDAYVGEITSDEQAGVFFKNAGNTFSEGLDAMSVNTVKQKWGEASDSEKLQYAQEFNFGKKGPVLNGHQIDNLFNNVIVPSIDQTNDYNRENKDYLGNIWKDTEGKRGEINKKNAILEDLNVWQVEQANKVISDVKSADPELAKKFEMYIDPKTGFVRSKFDFAKAYAEDAYANAPTTKTQTTPISSQDRGGFSTGMDMKMDLRTEGVGYTETQVALSDRDRREYYDRAYEEALGMYSSVKGEEGVFGGKGWVGYALGPVGIATQIIDYATSTTEKKGMDVLWAEQFGKHAEAKGQLTEMGLIGSGSYAVQGIQFENMDPSKYMSEATMQTTSFLQNAMMLDSENMRVSLGGPGSEIPGEDATSTTKPILNQFYFDIMNKKDPKDKTRPIANVVYQDIAGNSRDWTAMNIKVDSKYLSTFVQKTNSDGDVTTPNMISMEQYNSIMKDGMTVYIKKDAAQNGFRSAVDRSDTESTFFYTGKHKFDAYPELSPDPKNPLQLIKNQSTGGYTMSGNMIIDYYLDGTPKTTPILENYSPDANLNRIINDWNLLFEDQAYQNAGLYSLIPKEDLITDPAQLLE